MIEFADVGLRYGNGPEVLRDLTFSVEPGSFHFLTGPSGAGKTSLLRLLLLSRKPTRGQVTMFGEDVATLSQDRLLQLRRHIGIVFQEFRLLDHLTTYENVALRAPRSCSPTSPPAMSIPTCPAASSTCLPSSTAPWA